MENHCKVSPTINEAFKDLTTRTTVTHDTFFT